MEESTKNFDDLLMKHLSIQKSNVEEQVLKQRMDKANYDSDNVWLIEVLKAGLECTKKLRSKKRKEKFKSTLENLKVKELRNSVIEVFRDFGLEVHLEADK